MTDDDYNNSDTINPLSKYLPLEHITKEHELTSRLNFVVQLQIYICETMYQ